MDNKTIEELDRENQPTAFILREEHERILKEYNNYKVQAYEQLIELINLREALKEERGNIKEIIMEPKEKTAKEVKEEIMSWVRGADRYNQNHESHLQYAGNEIMIIMQEYAAQETAQLREALKELIPIAEGHIKIAHSLSIYPTEFEEIKKYKESIENARKLTIAPNETTNRKSG